MCFTIKSPFIEAIISSSASLPLLSFVSVSILPLTVLITFLSDAILIYFTLIFLVIFTEYSPLVNVLIPSIVSVHVIVLASLL